MNEMVDNDLSAAMALLDEKLKSSRPKRRQRKVLLAPYAAQLRRYVEAGWTRKEIVAEMKALGLSISAATLRDVLGSTPKRQPHAPAKNMVRQQVEGDPTP